MPSLADLPSTSIVKALYIGDSSTGKTGSLVSLVKAGYKIRMIDLDNGIGILSQFVKHECPDKLGNVSFVSPRDKYKAGPMGVQLAGAPVAFQKTMGFLEKWEDGTNPAEWGPEYILVLDSLTALGKAAYNWFDKLNPNVKDKRQVFYSAQDALNDVLLNVTANEFNTNVLIISHVTYNEEQTKGYASALGKAMGPKIPAHFNNLILAETVGFGASARRVIRTVSTGVVDLKTEVPFKLDKELPLSSGMATVFEHLKG